MSIEDISKENITTEWRNEAECHTVSLDAPDLATAWVSPDQVPKPTLELAKAICEECPVRWECLVSALDSSDAYGIRGGFNLVQGRALASDSKRIRRLTGKKPRIRHGAGRVDDSTVEQNQAS